MKSVPVSMMLPPKVSRSTMAAQRRGSVIAQPGVCGPARPGAGHVLCAPSRRSNRAPSPCAPLLTAGVDGLALTTPLSSTLNLPIDAPLKVSAGDPFDQRHLDRGAYRPTPDRPRPTGRRRAGQAGRAGPPARARTARPPRVSAAVGPLPSLTLSNRLRLFRPECSHEMSQAARPAHRALTVPRGRRTRCCVPAIHASRQEVRERCFVASSGKVRVAGAARCTGPDLPSDGVGIEGGMLLGEPLRFGFVTDIVTARSDRGMGVNKT